MGCLIVLFLVCPFLLDHMLNRDPNVYVDQSYRLSASGLDAPMALRYRGPYEMPRKGPPEQIWDVTDFRMSDRVFAGNSERGFFIVDRSNDAQLFFETEMKL